MPICSKCRQDLPLESFWGGKKRHRYCKPCCAEYQRAWSKKNPELKAALDRKYRHKKRPPKPKLSPAEREARTRATWAKYRMANKERLRQALLEYRAINKHRRAAQSAVQTAIKSGRLKRQVCELCGAVGEAHHASYAKEAWLDVTWLCRTHHSQLHAEFDAH